MQFWKSFAYLILGLILLIGLIIPTVLSLPICLYRWVVCQVLGPLFRRNSGRAVTLAGASMAAELVKDDLRDKPRFALVVGVVFEGAVTFEKLRDSIQDKWMTVKESTGGGLKYPEFQQYVHTWLGYPFWEQDKSFNLANHLTHHECDEAWTELECEKYACSISEELINKPFQKGRSPWEIHMISNYRNSGILPDGKGMSKLVFRFHHGMLDGFGMFSVICNGFFGIPLSKCSIAQPSLPKTKSSKSGCLATCLRNIIEISSFPMKVLRDFGYMASLALVPIRTPWYILESNRVGRHLCIRSRKIPVGKLKFVKNRFGVSFTAAVLSSIAAGVANSFKSKGLPNHIKDLPFGSPLPLRGHPERLRNHWTATLYGIPIDQMLSPLERLKESEEQFQNGKLSTFPYLFPLVIKCAGLQLPYMSRMMISNRTFSTAMSNFAGPGEKISVLDNEIVTLDCMSGLTYGVAGLGFVVLSYVDHIIISIVAENAAMERRELEELLESIYNEIDKLYELAESEIECKKYKMR